MGRSGIQNHTDIVIPTHNIPSAALQNVSIQWLHLRFFLTVDVLSKLPWRPSHQHNALPGALATSFSEHLGRYVGHETDECMAMLRSHWAPRARAGLAMQFQRTSKRVFCRM